VKIIILQEAQLYQEYEINNHWFPAW